MDVTPALAGHAGRVRVLRILRDHPVLAVFTIALVVRVLAATALFVVHGGQLFGDDKTYFDLASQRASGQTQAWTPYVHGLFRTTAAYTWPMVALFKVFGPIVLLGQLYTALLGALTAAGTSLVALEALRRGPAMAAGMIVALLPSQVLWSALTLKDAMVWMVAVAIALVVAVAGRTHASSALVPRLLALGLLLIVMGYLRHHTLVVVCWAAAIAVWFGHREGRWFRGAAVTAMAVLVPLSLGLGPAGWGLVTSSTASLETRRADNAIGAGTAVVAAPTAAPVQPGPVAASGGSGGSGASGSSGDSGGSTATPRPTQQVPAAAPMPPSDEIGGGSNLHYLPTGLRVILLDPAPWTRQANARVRLAQAESFVWWPLLLLAVGGLWAARRCLRVLAFPALAAGATAVMYGLSEGNFGTAFRHRGELVWAVAVFAGAALQSLQPNSWFSGAGHLVEQPDVTRAPVRGSARA
jgi:hypothetical protein